MDHERFRDWFSRVDELTATQRKEVAAVLSDPPEGAVALAAIELGVDDERRCPHCGAGGAVSRGKARGLRRFRCKECGRTFGALTGTALSGLHHVPPGGPGGPAAAAALAGRRTLGQSARLGSAIYYSTARPNPRQNAGIDQPPNAACQGDATHPLSAAPIRRRVARTRTRNRLLTVNEGHLFTSACRADVLLFSGRFRRFECRSGTPPNLPRGLRGHSSFHALGGGTTREPAERQSRYCSRLREEFQMVGIPTLGGIILGVWRCQLRVRGDRFQARAIPPSRRRSHRAAMHQERSQSAASSRLSPRTQPSPCGPVSTAAFPAAPLFRVSARSQSRNARASGFSPAPGAVARK